VGALADLTGRLHPLRFDHSSSGEAALYKIANAILLTIKSNQRAHPLTGCEIQFFRQLRFAAPSA